MKVKDLCSSAGLAGLMCRLVNWYLSAFHCKGQLLFYFPICWDSCHLYVMWEDFHESIDSWLKLIFENDLTISTVPPIVNVSSLIKLLSKLSLTKSTDDFFLYEFKNVGWRIHRSLKFLVSLLSLKDFLKSIITLKNLI